MLGALSLTFSQTSSTDALLKNVEMGLADESRIPHVVNAVDCLGSVFNYESNEHEDVTRHNIDIAIVDDDIERLAVALWELTNRLDNISQVSRSWDTVSLGEERT